MSSVDLEFHPKQGMAWKSEKKITLCCSGIQGGKTTVGALWLLRQVSQFPGPGDHFIIGAPTHKILNQSTLPSFLKWARGKGEHKKADSEFHFRNGAKAFIRTSTDPDSIEGIQDVRAIWLDEAGKCKYNFWINAEGRVARTKGKIFCTTTPYAMNWPYKHLIKPYQAGKREDVAYYEWLSIDNPTFPRSEYERQRLIMDPQTFQRKYMGMHTRMQGLVYEITDQNRCAPFKLPEGTYYFGGVDWGYSEGHEFALTLRGITPDGFRYGVDEFKKSGMDPNQQIDLLEAKWRTYNVKQFYADPARPDLIALAQKRKIPISAFQLGNENYKQIVPGIQAHNQLIRSGYYKIFEGRMPKTEDEYETYHWPETEEGDQPKEVPVKFDDHLMDAERMLTVGTMHLRFKEPRPAIVTRSQSRVDTWDPKKPSKKKKEYGSY
jgi:PBSX family phage terminase large subunit